MSNVLVQTEPEQYVFENSDFAVLEKGVLGVCYADTDDYHTAFPPGEWKAVSVYETKIQNDVPGEDLFDEIAAFMEAGGQVVPEHPEPEVPFSVNNFVVRVREELEETDAAFYYNKRPEAVDGFLDIAYAAITGALHIAGVKKTRECWEAIMRANTSKIDGTYGEIVRDEKTGKILKPEGWMAPDIEGILARD